MKCPMCAKEVEDVKAVRCNGKPYTAFAVFEGLEAWGAIQAEKETVCQNGKWVHFRFLHDGSERLVQMTRFDLRAIEEAHKQSEEAGLICEHEGCTTEGTPGYFEAFDEKPMGYYCLEHAHENGFCPGCMLFKSGASEFFDFDLGGYGMCQSCTDELETQFDDDPDEWGEDDVDDYF